MRFPSPSRFLFLAACTLFLTNALPSTPIIRAGGPAIVPIPANCTVTDLAPTLGHNSNQTYIPTPSTGNDIIWQAYYDAFSPDTISWSLQCLEQCNGYGGGNQCKTAFWAEEIVKPEGPYGSPGIYSSAGCLLFDRILGDADFEIAPEGQASNTFAWSLVC